MKASQVGVGNIKRKRLIARDRITSKPEVLLKDWSYLGDRLRGYFYGHRVIPDGSYCRTSALIQFDIKRGWAETQHSMYSLEGNPVPMWRVQMDIRREFKEHEFTQREMVHCRYCDAPLTPYTATVDHIVPRASGGSDKWSNFTMACKSCNSRKGSMPVKDFVESIGR